MNKILIVDDTTSFRLPIAAFLRREGYEMLSATNGKEALRVLQSTPPDLILLDVAMPGMDGISCLEELRKIDRLKNIPVIMLTAMSEADVVVKAALNGVNGYLLKSQFSLDMLLQKVKTQLTLAHESLARCNEVRQMSNACSEMIAVRTEKTSEKFKKHPILEYVQRDFFSFEAAPPVVAGALALFSAGGSTEEIASVIREDPALVVKILGLANLGSQSEGVEITALTDAITKIGTSEIKKLLLTTGVIEHFSERPTQGVIPQRFWEHALATATIAEIIAKTIGMNNSQEMFLAGLLHDVGRLLFWKHHGEEYADVVLRAANTNISLCQLEFERFGVTHAYLSRELLRVWNLPEVIVESAGNHEMLVDAVVKVSAYKKETLTLILANRLAHALAFGESGNAVLLDTSEISAALDLTPESLSIIAADATRILKERLRYYSSVRSQEMLEPFALELGKRLKLQKRVRVLANDGDGNPLSLFLGQLQLLEHKSRTFVVVARTRKDFARFSSELNAQPLREIDRSVLLIYTEEGVEIPADLSQRYTCIQRSFPVRYEVLLQDLMKLCGTSN
ncbi:MAG: HDOD domain-containing protein [Pseudobdellovibrionaceae bacterium]